jgi:hypothetical protein
MKLIGIMVGAAILTAAPFSVQCTPTRAGLYVDKADARVVYRRRHAVQHYRAASYPRPFAYSYPAPYYGVVPYPYSSGPPNLWGGFSGGYR